MKIYLAATFTEQEYMQFIAQRFKWQGHEITSTWIYGQWKPKAQTFYDFGKNMALKDLADLASSDLMILGLDQTSTTMGKMVEFGYAVARHIPVWLIGGTEEYLERHIFLRLADKHFKDYDACLTFLTTEFPTLN
jgi:nucleoside 2-deoxyribosyltransferase